MAPLPQEALSSPGRPLDARTRSEMEERFSWDFSRVRLHDDARAAAAAAAIHAAAYTVGQDIAFAAGRCAPSTRWGRELLVHELTHTIQQRDATAKAPPIPPGSALEREADEAGRTAGSRQKTIHPIGVSALAVARAPSRPEYLDAYDDDELADSARGYRVSLGRRPEYPGREKDVQMFEELSTEIERRGAVAEAKAVASRTEDEPEDEESTVTSMALSVGTRAGVGPSVRPAPRKPTPRQAPLSKFAPGGFTDEDIYADLEADKKRWAQPRDPRPFMDRFYAARRLTPIEDQSDDGKVWRTGLGEGCFSEDDRWAFEQVWEERIGKPVRQEKKRKANVESVRREMAWEAQGDKVVQDLQLGFIQGALVGSVKVFGSAAAAAYQVYTYADIGVETYRAKQSGRPEDIVGVALPLAAGMAMHAVVAPEPMAAPPGPSPVPASVPRAAGGWFGRRIGAPIVTGARLALGDLGGTGAEVGGLAERPAIVATSPPSSVTATPGPLTPDLPTLGVEPTPTPAPASAPVPAPASAPVPAPASAPVPARRLPPGPVPTTYTAIPKGTEPLPEGTHKVTTTLKPRLAARSDAEILADNLTREFGARPAGHDAHHIVPKGMRDADEARALLLFAEIGINDAANGIWLAGDEETVNESTGEIHDRVHTAKMIRWLTDLLREGATHGPAGVRRALATARRVLAGGKVIR